LKRGGGRGRDNSSVKKNNFASRVPESGAGPSEVGGTTLERHTLSQGGVEKKSQTAITKSVSKAPTVETPKMNFSKQKKKKDGEIRGQINARVHGNLIGLILVPRCEGSHLRIGQGPPFELEGGERGKTDKEERRVRP